VVVGESFRFGARRRGDVSTLASFGKDLGFRVRALAPLLEAGRPISSSRIARRSWPGGSARRASCSGASSSWTASW